MPSLNPPQRPGFWWSPLDPLVVVAAIGLTWLAWRSVGPFAGVIPLVVAHYLLFCNVVRMRPWREASWAVSMVWISSVVVFAGGVHWLPIALAVAPVTTILVLHEIRDPAYRGVLAERRPGWLRSA